MPVFVRQYKTAKSSGRFCFLNTKLRDVLTVASWQGVPAPFFLHKSTVFKDTLIQRDLHFLRHLWASQSPRFHQLHKCRPAQCKGRQHSIVRLARIYGEHSKMETKPFGLPWKKNNIYVEAKYNSGCLVRGRESFKADASFGNKFAVTTFWGQSLPP